MRRRRQALIMGPCLPNFTSAFTLYCMDSVTLSFFINYVPTIDYTFFTLHLSHGKDPCPRVEVEIGVQKIPLARHRFDFVDKIISLDSLPQQIMTIIIFHQQIVGTRVYGISIVTAVNYPCELFAVF